MRYLKSWIPAWIMYCSEKARSKRRQHFDAAASFVFLCPVIENGIAISELSSHAQEGQGK